MRGVSIAIGLFCCLIVGTILMAAYVTYDNLTLNKSNYTKPEYIIGDRIKVTSGKYSNLVGTIETEYLYPKYYGCKAHAYNISLCNNRRTFDVDLCHEEIEGYNE